MRAVPPDGRALVATALRTLLTGRGEPVAQGATVGTRIITDPESPLLPYVAVALDDVEPRWWPATAVALIRITVWAGTEDDAYDLAALSMGLLCGHRGGGIRGIRPGGRLFYATDRDTELPLCSASLRVQLSPRPI